MGLASEVTARPQIVAEQWFQPRLFEIEVPQAPGWGAAFERQRKEEFPGRERRQSKDARP